MRIVSGEFRGIRLNSLPGQNTRPTSDKVKESLFNIIGPYFSGGNALDLFAGSGNLGLEALSRGLDFAIFIEKNPSALQVIKKNVKKLRLEKQTEVLRRDAFKSIRQIAKKEMTFKFIFIDPPYHFKDIHKILEEILTHKILEDKGLIIYEHSSEIKSPEHESLFKLRELEYGATAITIYKKD